MAEETITWRPIADLEPGRVVLLKAARNNMGLSQSTFVGVRMGRSPSYFLGLYFHHGAPQKLMLDAEEFAYVEGL
jgi:hypothetical protein